MECFQNDHFGLKDWLKFKNLYPTLEESKVQVEYQKKFYILPQYANKAQKLLWEVRKKEVKLDLDFDSELIKLFETRVIFFLKLRDTSLAFRGIFLDLNFIHSLLFLSFLLCFIISFFCFIISFFHFSNSFPSFLFHLSSF